MPAQWCVPEDLSERGIAYDARSRGKGFSIRMLSTLDLDAQIGSDGATWLDRELTAKNPVPVARSGFGLDVDNALDKRATQLVRMGHAERDATSRTITFSRDLVVTLERQEVARVGKEMAAARGLNSDALLIHQSHIELGISMTCHSRLTKLFEGE
ncbi:DUF3363 domain-containing protein [Mesorhizobium sp. LjNodule214]|uniref:DUF3363 domain-containing protein n=1 Tax=Mesorhizobium sp. LjNodule214 TaxID=3342252 RepID=UPI003ED013D5